MLKLSQNGLLFIQEYEKLSLTKYDDGYGYGTIGWGHLIQPGENYTTITEEQANQLLYQDTAIAQRCINNKIRVDLNQNQFDALCSLVFNIGCGAFSTSTLLKLLNAGNYQDAAKQFLAWNKARDPETHQLVISAGLVLRRTKEMNIFLT
jgi:lysozyme